jgi:sirohydrochlorin ferrochelatase
VTVRPLPPLIGLAHGSRDPRAAVVIADVMRATAAMRPGLRAIPAFLDLCVPDLVSAISAARSESDFDTAIVVPLLFTNAYHATVDVPTAVGNAQLDTGVGLRLAGVLGMGEDVLLALEESAARAHIAAHEAILLYAVGSSHEPANEAVHVLARRWSERRLGPVWAGFGTVGSPSAADVLARAAAEGRRIGVVPLFLAPGLLLDQVARSAVPLGAEVASPLGTALSELVLIRYLEALAASP